MWKEDTWIFSRPSYTLRYSRINCLQISNIFPCLKVQRFSTVIKLQAAGQFLDLSVITGDGVRDDCHTLVLAACSPVFAACSPSSDSCLLLPDFTSADFINLLGTLYGGPTRSPPLISSLFTSPLLFHCLFPPFVLSSPLSRFFCSPIQLSSFPLLFSTSLPLPLRSSHIPPGEAEGLHSLIVALGITNVTLEPVILPGGEDTLTGTH